MSYIMVQLIMLGVTDGPLSISPDGPWVHEQWRNGTHPQGGGGTKDSEKILPHLGNRKSHKERPRQK